MKSACLSATLALTCGGCVTGIAVTHVNSDNRPLTGNPWNLPMTQFKITITRHVTKCGKDMQGAVETIATSIVAPDPDQRYLLSSTGWFATSDITSNLAPAGFSTGLNASSADSTATVISNVVGTVGQLALFGAAAGAGKEGTPPPAPTEGCSEDVQNAVDALYPSDKKKKGLKQVVELDTAELANSTARLSLLTAKAVSDKSIQGRIVAALQEQDDVQTKLAKDQKALTDALSASSDTTIVTWPLLSSDFHRSEAFRIDPEVLANWLPKQGNVDSQTPRVNFDVYAALYRQKVNDGTWVTPATSSPVDTKIGVPARLAATGRLMLCVATPCPEVLPAIAARNKKQMASDFQVLQLGPIYVLPVTGGRFKSESAAITLDQSGLPTQLQTSEKVAAAAGLTGAAKDAATQAAGLPASLRAAELSRTQAETNQLKANADLETAQASAGIQGNTATLTAQAAFITAQNNLGIAKKNAGINISTAELTAQSNLISAQSTLITAQANAGVIDQTSVLAAHTALANAQAALINANIALAKAQTTTQ